MSDVALGLKLGRLTAKHERLRSLVAAFLREIATVPFRAADCDHKTLSKLEKQLRKEVGENK